MNSEGQNQLPATIIVQQQPEKPSLWSKTSDLINKHSGIWGFVKMVAAVVIGCEIADFCTTDTQPEIRVVESSPTHQNGLININKTA